MRLRHAVVHCLVLLAAGAVASPAQADVEKARTLFAEGIRLFKQGDWEGSRRLFREADAEHHAPAIVYNLALAEERLGHPQAAVDAFEAYLAEAGDGGELAIAAASAVAQIKARSTRLRVDTRPPGARVFVDGSALPDPAPATVLVPAGHHVVVAQGDGWRAEREIEVGGRGDALGVLLERPAELAPSAPAPPPAAPPAIDRAAPAPSIEAGAPDGLVWGASFAAAPVYLLGITKSGANNSSDALSVFAGPLLEIGYAMTDRFEILARGLAGIGPDADPAYAFMGGPALSYRAAGPLWLGATFIGGRFETRAHDDARYGTDLVFGVMLEANVTLVKKPWGEWSAGLQPGLLLTNVRQDNTAIFFPITFGYRAY